MPNSDFYICEFCHRKVFYIAPGTRNRNHCPFCLHSKHVDERVGDRMSACGGLMPAIGKMYKNDGEEVLIHKCSQCSLIRKNRVAGDDSYELIETLPVWEYF